MSPDPRLLWNAPTFPTRKPRAAEYLWSMRKDGKQIEAQLRGHGEYGWELQLLRDGDFYAGRRFDLREQAITLMTRFSAS